MAASLGTLFSDTFKHLQKNMTTIAIGVVVFGVIMAGINWYMAGQARGVASTMGVDTNRMEELAEMMEAGDEAAVQEMMAEFEKTMGGLAADESAVLGLYQKMAPTFILVSLISALVFMVAMTYYTVVALKSSDVQTTLNDVMKLLLPMIALQIWVFLRSFAWVPIAGVVLGIILGPRFILAPVLLIKEKKGVFESASASYERTKGYWGKIFGNMFVVAILGVITVTVLSRILSIGGVQVAMVATALLSQVFAAYLMTFATKLAVSILGGGKVKPA